jgi:putative oxidoreductase
MLQGLLSVAGRVLLCGIFLMSAAGQKIPKFGEVAGYMEGAGVPMPKVALAGAIVFLLAGGVSVVVGYRARLGAALLAVFLVLATYYFHAFWKLDGQQQQEQMIHFMKNSALLGAMLFLVANGPGAGSVDAARARAGG